MSDARIRRWIAFALLAFLVAAIALFPLRLALRMAGADGLGLSARSVSGSVWSGALEDARLGPVGLGDLALSLEPGRLLFGESRFVFASAGPEPLQGALRLDGDGFAVERLTGPLDLAAVPLPVALSGFRARRLSVRFAGGRCVAAEGRVEANLAGALAGLGLGAPVAGEARCEAGALLLPLVAAGGGGQLGLKLFADGRYRLQFRLPRIDPALAEPLRSLGFGPAGGGAALQLDGSF